MSVSSFDHRVLSGLLGDSAIAEQLSAEVELTEFLRFESALAHAQAENEMIPYTAAAAISARCDGFEPDWEAMTRDAAIDGAMVPELVRQLRAGLHDDDKPYLHYGAASQDAIDTGLSLRLKRIAYTFDERLANLVAEIDALEGRFGDRSMTGRTRMQDAIPVTVSDRLATWRLPLVQHRERLEALWPHFAVLQFGGAAGTRDKVGDKGSAVATRLADLLGLACPERPWHSQRAGLVDFADWLSLISGSLGKMGQDAALMAQNSVGELKLEGGGGSSAMPHKANPINAEVLVSLARYNATLVSGMHQALVHEQERSGQAWTLEWLVLPQMLMTTAASTNLAARLLTQIRQLGT